MFRVTALRFVAWVKQLFPLESLRPNQRMSRNGRATCRSTLHETGVSPQMQNQMEMREAGLPPPKWSQTANWAAALICTVNDKLLALTCALGERAATPIATWGLTLMFDAILARQAAAGPARPVADQRALALVPLVVFVPKGAVSEARDNPKSDDGYDWCRPIQLLSQISGLIERCISASGHTSPIFVRCRRSCPRRWCRSCG
jgi:hypothetical protein